MCCHTWYHCPSPPSPPHQQLLGEKWRGLTPEERVPYEELAAKDKERFQAEMAAYKETLAAAEGAAAGGGGASPTEGGPSPSAGTPSAAAAVVKAGMAAAVSPGAGAAATVKTEGNNVD